MVIVLVIDVIGDGNMDGFFFFSVTTPIIYCGNFTILDIPAIEIEQICIKIGEWGEKNISNILSVFTAIPDACVKVADLRSHLPEPMASAQFAYILCGYPTKLPGPRSEPGGNGFSERIRRQL